MNDYRAYVENDYNAIYHHGVKGQRWGIRRYQNEDGTLTPEGIKRYRPIYNRMKKAGKSDKEIGRYITNMNKVNRSKVVRLYGAVAGGAAAAAYLDSARGSFNIAKQYGDAAVKTFNKPDIIAGGRLSDKIIKDMKNKMVKDYSKSATRWLKDSEKLVYTALGIIGATSIGYFALKKREQRLEKEMGKKPYKRKSMFDFKSITFGKPKRGKK